MESQSQGFPDAPNPGRPAQWRVTTIKDRGVVLYGVPMPGFPGRWQSRAPSPVACNDHKGMGVFFMESQTKGVLDAPSPGRPAQWRVTTIKDRSVVLYGVPKPGFPGRPQSRAPSPVACDHHKG